MNNGNIKTSNRLKKMLNYLSDGKEHSTRDISVDCEIQAVGTTASELRANGIPVNVRYSHKTDNGARVYLYSINSKKSMVGNN